MAAGILKAEEESQEKVSGSAPKNLEKTSEIKSTAPPCKPEIPTQLSDSQLNNMDPLQLVERADRLADAIDKYDKTKKNKKEEVRDDVSINSTQYDSDSSSDSSSITDSSDSSNDTTDYDSDDSVDSVNSVVLVKVDVGTSPTQYELVPNKKSSMKKSHKPSGFKPENESKGTTSRKQRTRRPRSQSKEKLEKKKFRFEGKVSSQKESSSSTPAFRGRTNTLYLQNINRPEGVSFKDIADGIKDFAMKKGYLVTFARVFPNKFRDDIVSCRITVPENQSEEMIGSGQRIWPRDVTCRRWSNAGPPSSNQPEQSQHRHSKYPKRRSNLGDWMGNKLRNGRITNTSEADLGSCWETDSESDHSENERRIWFKKFVRFAYAHRNENPWEKK